MLREKRLNKIENDYKSEKETALKNIGLITDEDLRTIKSQNFLELDNRIRVDFAALRALLLKRQYLRTTNSDYYHDLAKLYVYLVSVLGVTGFVISKLPNLLSQKSTVISSLLLGMLDYGVLNSYYEKIKEKYRFYRETLQGVLKDFDNIYLDLDHCLSIMQTDNRNFANSKYRKH